MKKLFLIATSIFIIACNSNDSTQQQSFLDWNIERCNNNIKYACLIAGNLLETGDKGTQIDYNLASKYYLMSCNQKEGEGCFSRALLRRNNKIQSNELLELADYDLACEYGYKLGCDAKQLLLKKRGK